MTLSLAVFLSRAGPRGVAGERRQPVDGGQRVDGVAPWRVSFAASVLQDASMHSPILQIGCCGPRRGIWQRELHVEINTCCAFIEFCREAAV